MTYEYPVLDNRPIDQWKVTELKDELKRRNLTTRGLKEVLVKRLDEALRAEIENNGEKKENGFNDDPESKVDDEVAETESGAVSESDVALPDKAEQSVVGDDSKISEVETASVQVDNSNISDRGEQLIQEEVFVQRRSELVTDEHTGVEMSSVTDVPSAVMGDQVSESLPLETAIGGQKFQDDKQERDNEDARVQQVSEDIKPPHVDVKLNSSYPNNQVSEVNSNLGFPLKSNSNSADSFSICEKKELEDNVIADNVKLETDVKPEMVQPSSSNLVPVGGESHPKGVEEPLQNELSVGGRDNNVTDVDISQKNLSASLGSSEKLNLDRSSGDDFMEEDALESKQIESNNNTGDVGVRADKSEVTTLKEESPFTATDTDFPTEEKSIPSEEKDVVAAAADKRKLPDQGGLNTESSKRQRRWKSEGSNSGDQPQISKITPPVTAKHLSKSSSLTRNVPLSDSDGVIDTSKEREVPPSKKAATCSLRIDNFLRPFTLKAVQDLLAKTGTVTSFWMDHIKTHCYVTYSTVEESIATRNAVYNLQWPPNGGRCLVAEFADPQEVKVRVDPPPEAAMAPVRAATSIAPELSKQQQPSPRQHDLRQQLLSRQPALPLPPPPPLSNPILARERVYPILPPPPPEKKEEAPILTLDDLFRKTKATPRIYYLPLSEEQVSSTIEAQQKKSGQPPIA